MNTKQNIQKGVRHGFVRQFDSQSDYVCNKCLDCQFYWQNNNYDKCEGQRKPCAEYIPLLK